MKKLIYLFLTVLIVGCSDDDSSNNNCLGELDLIEQLTTAASAYTNNPNDIENCQAYVAALTLYINCSAIVTDAEAEAYQDFINLLDCTNEGNNAFSLAGIWNLTSQTNAAGPVDLEATCANENFIELNDTSGTAYFHFNENSEGNIVPCFVAGTDTCTYTNTPAGSNQYLLTTSAGVVLSGELNNNGTILSIIDNDDVLNFTKQ
jgi:hypothetical protein